MSQRSDRIRTLASTSRFRVGGMLVHPERLTIERDGEDIALEPRLMEVLVALAERAGEVISAEQLLIEVWRGTFYGDNPVHRAIAQLRRHLGDDPRNPVCIETIRKRGYRLIAPVAFPADYRPHPLQAAGWSGRNPYVGLAAFDPAHADVFFGRTRHTAQALVALRQQRENGRGLVLLAGASGSGKSSLLQAGVLPMLRRTGGFDGLEALAAAHCDFAATQPDALERRLAEALAGWSLDDRPILPPQPADALAGALAARPQGIAEALDEAWRRRPPTQRGDGFALLTLDHLEALASANPQVAAARARLWRIVEAICAHPRGACIAIVRGDAYPALLAALPQLAERKGGDGHVDVLPPQPGEIAQIVRMPALLAGLSFEEDRDGGLRLDDVLRDAAAAQPDALPLLQHTLQALYERRDEKGMLGFAAYREIGGLEGALAQRAETTFLALPAPARARLDAVLSLLVAVAPDRAEIGARRALRDTLPDADAQRLVDAFVAARLFVAGSDGGRADVGVTHEALLRQWPRARDWAHDNRRLLQAHARLQQAAARWDASGRREDHLLHPGQPLADALEVRRHLPRRIAACETALIEASLRLRRRGQRRRRLAVAALATLAAAASGFALWAGLAQREAERRREQALQLSDYMLIDLADKLRPMGNLHLMHDIGQQALATLEPDDLDALQAPELVNRARALRTLGEVLMEQAQTAPAERAFTAAAEAATRARARAPTSQEAIAEAGVAAYWVGYLHFRRGEYPQAGRHWRRYLDHTAELLRLAPTRPEWLVERSYALNNLGTLAKTTGRADAAIAHFRASAALKRRALQAQPDDADLRYELIDTLSWISSAEQAQGRLADAASGYATQIEMLRALVAAHPTALAWERRLATSLRRSADLALMRGERASARAMLEESIIRLDALLPKAPDNQVWRRDLAHALLDRAELARLDGATDLASGTLRRAQALSSDLLRSGGADKGEWRRLDAMVRVRMAALRGRTADEHRALDDLSRLVEEMPEDVGGRTALAQALIARGQRRAAVGNAAAEDDFARARTLLSALAADSRDPTILAPWARAHVFAGLDASAALERLRLAGYRDPAVPLGVADPASAPAAPTTTDTAPASASAPTSTSNSAVAHAPPPLDAGPR